MDLTQDRENSSEPSEANRPFKATGHGATVVKRRAYRFEVRDLCHPARGLRHATTCRKQGVERPQEALSWASFCCPFPSE